LMPSLLRSDVPLQQNEGQRRKLGGQGWQNVSRRGIVAPVRDGRACLPTAPVSPDAALKPKVLTLDCVEPRLQASDYRPTYRKCVHACFILEVSRAPPLSQLQAVALCGLFVVLFCLNLTHSPSFFAFSFNHHSFGCDHACASSSSHLRVHASMSLAVLKTRRRQDYPYLLEYRTRW
jgi:hypothetical protein